jgi:uncharacterized protein (TIGR02145 family)
LATHYCHNGQTYSCGNQPYNPSTHFCYSNSKVGQKCGARTEIFDPDLYQCVDNGKIYLKTPVSYGVESYEAVLIGTQTWMARNLNYKTSDGASRCYPTSGSTNASDADNSNCNIYGRMYTWSTAMNNSASSTSNPSGRQGVCPSGWHIPSDAEWTALTDFVGSSTAGTKLKAASNWSSNGNGTDEYGFSALPGGFGGSGGYFIYVGYLGGWWSSTEYGSSLAYDRYMIYGNSDVVRNYNFKSPLLSVRCVQD